MSAGWEASTSDRPKPPMNCMAFSPYKVGVYDLRWDDPSLLSANTQWTVLGANIYRSDASDRGPYRRVNEVPVGTNFFRDRTVNVLVKREVVDFNSSWVHKGDAPNNRRWSFRSKHPMVKQEGRGVFASAPSDVTVEINGEVVEVDSVFGRTGEVVLANVQKYDVAREKHKPPVVIDENTVVTVSYYRNKNLTPGTALDRKVFYRITTVAITENGLVETALENCPPVTPTAIEELDYIWKEAIRRNQWILQQGGERVKVFIRKTTGRHCSCGMDEKDLEYTKQPNSRCKVCYGTGFVGGYEGPYETIVAPEDGDRRVSQMPQGRRVELQYEVFMGPSPMVTMRDFIVKQTNERYSIGAVRRPSNRGNVLQQHFTIGLLDEGDARYQVPIDGTSSLTYPETRFSHSAVAPAQGQHAHSPPHPVGPDATTPMVTEKGNFPDETEKRGRTPVWDNIEK